MQSTPETTDKIKTGHTTPETALIVNDYPYGFRLRTKIRYWITTDKKKGDRFYSQTLHPTKQIWNKPKCSTYSAVMIMISNEQDHITYRSISLGWSGDDELKRFLDFAGDYSFNEHQQDKIKQCQAINNTNKHISVKCVNATGWTPEESARHKEQQRKERIKIGMVYQQERKKLDD